MTQHEPYKYSDRYHDKITIYRPALGMGDVIAVSSESVHVPFTEVPAMCAAALRLAGLPVPDGLLPSREFPNRKGAVIECPDGERAFFLDPDSTLPWFVSRGSAPDGVVPYRWVSASGLAEWAGDDWFELGADVTPTAGPVA